jgi:alkyl hydroperoxide reductase subunit AhpF
MPPLLNEKITSQVREVFDAQLKELVEVLFFGNQQDSDYDRNGVSADTRQLLEEVIALSPKLHLSVYDVEADADLARQYRVDKTPTTVFAARDEDGAITDYGIQFAGIPAGHEFSSLVHDIILISGRDSWLEQSTRDFLKTLEKPLHLQVFVTPT